MELVEGEDLAQRIARGPLPVEEALAIARQIAEAFEAAHEQGIIHRDLKPANIKIRPDGTVKVLDFGLAKATTGAAGAPSAIAFNSPTITSPAMTEAGIILGTAAYMAPEQARGKAVDKRSDIWAFGCVLFEMLTGRRPFEGSDVSDIMASVLKSEPQWTMLPAATPLLLRRLLVRCLEKEPRQRLRDIGEARIALEGAAISGGDADITAATSGGRLSWRAAAFIAAVAIASTAVLAWALRPVSSAAPLAHVAILLPADVRLLVHDLSTSLALSPDGTELVYVGQRRTGYQLYRRSLDSLAATPLAGTEGGSYPFFSPDGQWVGFHTGNELKKVPLSGGAATRVLLTNSPWGATWATDGYIYLAQRWEGESLARVRAEGGTLEVVSRPDAKRGEASHRWPHAIAGTNIVLFAVGAGASFDEGRVAALNTTTGEWKTLVEGGSSPRFVPPDRLLFSRAGALLQVAFDPSTQTVSGTPVPVLEGVATNRANGDAQYDASATGAIAYVAGGTRAAERGLAWLDRRGELTVIADDRRAYEDLSLSPDGRRLAVTIEGPAWNIWVRDLERDTLTRFTEAYTNTDPLWSRDGRRIVFTSFRDGKYGLYWKLADGSGHEERLVTSDHFLHAYSFSPDGRFLAYGEQPPVTGGDLWIVPLAGAREPRLFLGGPAAEWYPAFSPDGRWIAYESDDSGRPEIYAQPFPGPGGRIQISTDGGTHPNWASTGREIFYLSTVGSSEAVGATTLRLMSVAIEPGAELRARRPQAVFERRVLVFGHPYDSSPDAQRFVTITPGDEGEAVGAVNLLLHWRPPAGR
jgi:Tol biopolymer transport system component